EPYEPLRGKSLAMLFEKASTRTRVSFEVGMTQLGGHALFLSPNDLQIGRGETISDTARVLSRYVDGILYRAFKRENVQEVARNATGPVINGLDDKEHPCQVIADLFTILEHKGGAFKQLKLAYVGDGNNVCNSLLLGAALVGMDMTAACPSGYEPDAELLGAARGVGEESGSTIRVVDEPRGGVPRAAVVCRHVRVALGAEREDWPRRRVRAAPGLRARRRLAAAVLRLLGRRAAVRAPDAPLTPAPLPLLAFFSVLRMVAAYVLSLLFAISYGHTAATNRRAATVMLPVMDI